MIAYLSGTIIATEPGRITVLCGGVGYELWVGASIGFLMDQQTSLWIHHHITEANQELFGFNDETERAVFCKLISVSGVGPKTALGMLDRASWQGVVSAIIHRQADVLSGLPGIGKKTAEKIILDLHNKFEGLAVAGSPATSDALAALRELGYHDRDIMPVLQTLESTTVEMMIKEALKQLR